MYGIYSVLDVKAGEFRHVFLQRSDESAVRMFTDAIMHGEDSMLRRYPADYQLHRLGEFSEMAGTVSGAVNPLYLVSAEDVLRRADSPRLQHMRDAGAIPEELVSRGEMERDVVRNQLSLEVNNA